MLVRWNLDEAEDLAHALLMSWALVHEIMDEMNDCTALRLGEKNDKRIYGSKPRNKQSGENGGRLI